MPGLPLLKIPRVAQNEIWKHVNTFDLISLSFCSEKARVLVETADVPLGRLDFAFHESDDLIISVNRNFKIGPKNRRQWGPWYGEPLEVICSEERGAKRRVKLLESTQDSASLRELLIGHFMETFRRIEAIGVYNHYHPIREIPVWKYTKCIEKIIFQRPYLVKSSKEEVEFLLDELTVQHLELRSIVVEGFRYSQGFQQKSVNIAKATFVDFDAILNSQSEKIHLLSIERPTIAQLNTLLKLWMSMEKMQNLCYLKLKLAKQTPFPINFLKEVLNGIVHERRSHQSAIIRRMDGRVAQITSDSYFKFSLALHPRN